ncbi:hypothetical protein [Streptomyces sp. NBC_01285]|uniref:hypothetical protein n=1 Tax=Streptomyces sp. NBC_01285 TaxID=2903813 RepID=UPI00225A79CE|nr:hypothetical protein [Streptomyces sp. NBC_01285]MCX4773717.1 hypothetical protein [Streptomyces sp. NBC_01285]
MKTTDQYAVDTDMDGVLFTARLATVGVLLLAALCAPRETSERAFRLLDLMKDNPEPPPPAPAPSARRRAQQGGR